MGYYQHLQQLLHPLRVYRLDSGASGAELFAEGETLDRVMDMLDAGEREAIPYTAEDEGLAAYEEIMPFVPGFSDDLQRRQAIMALLRIDWCSFTLEALRSTLSGCGVAVGLNESEIPETVEVVILGVRGVPDNFDDIAWRVEQILPCHLDILYVFTFMIWRELEQWMVNWNVLERKVKSWLALEKYEE